MKMSLHLAQTNHVTFVPPYFFSVPSFLYCHLSTLISLLSCLSSLFFHFSHFSFLRTSCSLGTVLTVTLYASNTCSAITSTVTFTMDVCVATPATSSSGSLGYTQWSYATAISAPLLTGYVYFLVFAFSTPCTSPISIKTFKLNECNVLADGAAYIYTITSTPFSAIKQRYIYTQYSDSACTAKTGVTSSGITTLNTCMDSTYRGVQSTAFQLTSETPMVMLRYFSRLILL